MRKSEKKLDWESIKWLTHGIMQLQRFYIQTKITVHQVNKLLCLKKCNRKIFNKLKRIAYITLTHILKDLTSQIKLARDLEEDHE